MFISEQEDEITARYIPFITWIYSLFQLIVVLFVLGGFIFAAINPPPDIFNSNKSRTEIFFTILWFYPLPLLFLLLLLYAAFIGLRTPYIKIIINGKLKTIEIIKWELFHKTQQTLNFHQIKNFEFGCEVQRKFRLKLYYNILRLVNDKQIKIPTQILGLKHTERMTDIFNNFLEKHHHSIKPTENYLDSKLIDKKFRLRKKNYYK